MLDKCTFRFPQWDPANPNNKYEGTKEQWTRPACHGPDSDDLDVKYEVCR